MEGFRKITMTLKQEFLGNSAHPYVAMQMPFLQRNTNINATKANNTPLKDQAILYKGYKA